MKKIVTTAIEVHVPMVPNFLLTGDDNTPVSIAKFTEKELKEIGKQWTENLIKKAKSKKDVIQ
jgi:predicted GIY-YIG superfamily endonuclease